MVQLIGTTIPNTDMFLYLELKEKLAGLRESYAALLEGDGDDAKAFRKAMERFDSTAERMSRKIDVFELLKNDPQGQQIEHTALFVANEAKRSYDVAPEVIYQLLVQIEKTTDLLSKETADEAPMGEIALEPLNKAHLMAKRFLHEALKILFYRYYRSSADGYADLGKVFPQPLHPLFLTHYLLSGSRLDQEAQRHPSGGSGCVSYLVGSSVLFCGTTHSPPLQQTWSEYSRRDRM